MAGAFYQNVDHELLSFTRRENEILALLADHLSDGEIAARLSLGLNTVKWYVRQISQKLGTHSRRQAVQRALELGWVNPHQAAWPEAGRGFRAQDARGDAHPEGENPFASYRLRDLLTAREVEVLSLIAQGMTNQQIADIFVLSVGTVKWYSREIYQKLGVGNRMQAVARAREIHLLS